MLAKVNAVNGSSNKWRFLVLLLLGWGSIEGCSKQPLSPGLVNLEQLGTLRGYSWARIQTHFHSPYSFDACDSGGLVNGVPNARCLANLKSALCTNHVDLAFVTDHANHLADFDFETLVMAGAGDTVLRNGSSEPIGNRLGCSDGFAAQLAPGLEGKLLALGMERHVSGTVNDRYTLYGGETATDLTSIQTQTGALMGIPHTESRDLSLIRTLNPSFIEIYNVHANLDPKIRKRSLGLPPFQHIAKMLNYLVDPYNDLHPDFFFIEFVEMFSGVMQKWNTLLSEGRAIRGVAGLDSHENVFAQTTADGERLDSHRRMTRFMSNWVMTSSRSIADIKSALQAGRAFVVFEGFGTPEGINFYGTDNGATVEMGGTATIAGGETSSIVARVPGLLSSSRFLDSDEDPYIFGEIHRVDDSGNETVVASARSGTLTYNDPPSGHYRLHVYMIPLHLRDVIFSKTRAIQSHLWAISNPVRVVR